jgi:hypothetical protein
MSGNQRELEISERRTREMIENVMEEEVNELTSWLM